MLKVSLLTAEGRLPKDGMREARRNPVQMDWMQVWYELTISKIPMGIMHVYVHMCVGVCAYVSLHSYIS